MEAVQPGAYNIASGEPRTVGEMAHALCQALGGPGPVVTGAYRLGDVRHIVASPALAEAVRGFKAEIVFSEGMVEFARSGRDGEADDEAAVGARAAHPDVA